MNSNKERQPNLLSPRIPKYPELSAGTERSLSLRAADGDAEAIRELWERQILPAWHLANRHLRRLANHFRSLREDLMQEALLAIPDALETYEPDRGPASAHTCIRR
ncbi:hypothetical protein [Alienimonas sp. DA493]|uniref:hypothetical protein n=1 Tax=Alienimonas sp. DA493 TaxID=3373605 RepID=UPI0037542BA2